MQAALDQRFTSPIATRSEVSTLLGVATQRLSAWTAVTSERAALVHTTRTKLSRLTFPLVGIAEASTLNALRSSGMTMQTIRSAANYIRNEHNDEYALASPKFVTDGTDAFVQDQTGLTRMKDKQFAIREAIRDHLRPLVIGTDGFVEAFTVERFRSSAVTIDPRFNAGQMSFVRNRVPLFIVAGALAAGERPSEVARDFGLSSEEVADVLDHARWLLHFG